VSGALINLGSLLMYTQIFIPRVVIYLVLLSLLVTIVLTVFINFVFPGWVG